MAPVKRPAPKKINKSEMEMQKRLERYRTNDRECKTCFAAWKAAKKDIAEQRKEKKAQEKANRSKDEQIRALLSEASKHRKMCETFRENGKDGQANNKEKLAKQSVSEASEIFHKMTNEERDKLDLEERKWLEKGELPPFPYLCSEKELLDMERKETNMRLTALESKLRDYEQMIHDQKMFSQQLIEEIQNSVEFIQDQNQVQRLQSILQEVQE